MLILSRRLFERIIIDNRIVLTVTKIDGDRVSIGIDAPRDVPVDREEIHQAKQRAKSDAQPLDVKR